MRYRLAVAFLSVALLIVVVTPAINGQGKSRFGGGFPGGGFPGGGFPGGGFPGGGGFGGGFGNRDPNQMFDFLAKGRGYFLVTDTNRLREPLTQFLQGKGITNGQVTRELFAAYNEQVKSGLASGPGGFSSPDRGPGGPSFSMNPQGGGNPLDTLNQLAETEFKIRDRNGDGFLNQDEMPDQLKSELSKWDANRDNLINLDEFKVYYVARMQSRRGGRDQSPNPVTIILEDEDLETRPVVYRAGKLPTKELPSWFMELDTNKDGQVALYEWYKGGKDVDEFRDWDRDNDGFITAEEALRKHRAVQLASASSKAEDSGDSPAPAPSMQSRKGPPGGMGGSRDYGGQGGEDRGKGKGKKGNFKFEFKRPQ